MRQFIWVGDGPFTAWGNFSAGRYLGKFEAADKDESEDLALQSDEA